MFFDSAERSEWKTTSAISAVSMQPHFSFLSRLFFCSRAAAALLSVLILLISTHPKPRGGFRSDRQTDAYGRLLLYWRILLVYSLSLLVCYQPLMHCEWLRTDPTEHLGRAFRGQKAFHIKWPTKSAAPRGNKSQRDGEAMQKGPAAVPMGA